LTFWTVVQAQPMNERRVIMHLDRQGFTHYAPREKITRVTRGRRIPSSRYIFPRYLFVLIEEGWHRLFSTFGVTKVLMNGQEPARLPDDFVTKMKASERNGLIELPKKSNFTKGQAVQVTGGLFIGCKGLYQGATSQQREVVLLNTLGRMELASGLLR
jgi:transcriptional antiterminator RfaH